MCAPTDTNNNNGNTATPQVQQKHVVIVGAGPSGLLLSNLLLHRNTLKHTTTTTTTTQSTTTRTEYKVTLVDSRIDVGILDVDTELTKYRSWMIALAGHGLEAVRTVPELYEEYISQKHVGVKIEEFNIFLGSKELKNSTASSEEEATDQEAFVVDRNYVCAAMAKFMDEKHSNNPMFDRRYETDLMYVDSNNRRVLLRDQASNEEEYLNYDLLVGADGSRSVVRDTFTRDVYSFETDFGDIFNMFRAVHVQTPKGVAPNAICLLPECVPHMTGILLPMPDGLCNISIGVTTNNFDKIPSELKSNDVTVVAGYFRNNFKAFEFANYEDFATKWIANGRWNRTAMVHCNQYHNLKAQAIIMGDAAHATSPSIGMGMNTALRDAQKFAELLEEYQDDFEKVLPAYSTQRVPEGNSLTDMAFHLYCLDTKVQMLETLHLVVRGKLHKWFPSWVLNHPQALIGQSKYTLTDCYKLGTNVNVIPKHREINNRIRQDYFEKQVGMKSDKCNSNNSIIYKYSKLAILGALIGIGIKFAMERCS